VNLPSLAGSPTSKATSNAASIAGTNHGTRTALSPGNQMRAAMLSAM
jgi:hypothetical protein